MARKVQMMVIRGLAFIIDLIVVFIPVQVICFLIFKNNFFLANFFGQILFIVYNMVMINIGQGKTVGKYFSGIRVFNEDSHKAYVKALREFCKLLYFISFPVGILFLGLSIVLTLVTGRSLHDYVGGSTVILDKEYEHIFAEHHERTD
ncbi:RDD family protein [Oenococcus sicerae]|uniref:RDD family protein n=1 Tax=Oenococcus sicerae TaxID=2203724 RepID=A0AAJ1RDU9_9LACO|nr:RDD family protein [Oenococcus sicerae]MDN6900942.1 RDD family protein [Oenococcus sicerae]